MHHTKSRPLKGNAHRGDDSFVDEEKLTTLFQ
jgi:hypothetical protein